MKLQYSTENKERSLKLVSALQNWYDKSSRDLVWRKTQEPYSIWISEIMAQQTRISAVLPYYERFMALFPHVEDLAVAPIDVVLKAWEGLGYYSRAHNLSKTAKIIVEQYGGQFPKDVSLLKKLPGIGDYTAGAIASICFQEPIPAVDGNVLRVFARLEDNEMDIKQTATKKCLTNYVADILTNAKPGIFNQALMELGALICLPKNPACEECPVSVFCKAKQLDKQRILPYKSPKKEQTNADKTILIIVNPKNEVLLRQRTERLLHGLWEFYMPEVFLEEDEIENALPYTLKKLSRIGEASHAFTHIRWNMIGYKCDIEETEPLSGYEFVSIEEMQKRAMPVAISFYTKCLLEFYGIFPGKIQ